MGLFSSKIGTMSDEKRQYVKDVINKDVVVIFSKSYCPYCKLAKDVSNENIQYCHLFLIQLRLQVFDKIEKKYNAIELDLRDDGEEIQAILGEITGAKTVCINNNYSINT